MERQKKLTILHITRISFHLSNLINIIRFLLYTQFFFLNDSHYTEK